MKTATKWYSLPVKFLLDLLPVFYIPLNVNVCLPGMIFYKKDRSITIDKLIHQRIHHAQIVEWIYVAIPCYFLIEWWSLLFLITQPIIYFLSWLWNVIKFSRLKNKDRRKELIFYFNILEREAWENELQPFYFHNRIPFNYLFL